LERRWKVLIVVSVAVFMASLDLFIVNIAFPDIRADFSSASIAGLSWVLNAYTIVFAALLVPAGRLADRFGRRRAFLTGLGVFLAGSALCGLAPTLPALVAARVLQAVGAATLMPASLGLLLPEFPPHERAAAIGVWAAVGGVAAAAGPPLGGLLVESSWRLVFLVNLPVGAIAAFYGARLLVETRDETERGWPDLIGTAVLIAGVGALALALVKAPAWHWADPRTVGTLAFAAIALAVFWARCARHPSPVVDLAMLRVRSFAMASAAQLLFAAAFAAMLLGNVLFLTTAWHESVLSAGLMLAPGPTMAAISAVLSGRAATRAGQHALAGVGCALFAVGIGWWLWRVTPSPDYAGAIVPGLLVTGIGVGLTLPSLASAAASSLPPARFATGSAVLNMSRQLGSALGVAVLFAVIGTPTALSSFQAGWRFMVIPAVLASFAAFAIGSVRAPRATPLVPAEAPAA